MYNVVYKFLLAYFVIFTLPFPLGYLPGTESVSAYYESLWQAAVPWVGKYVLQLGHEITNLSTDRSDTAYEYVKALCQMMVAAVTVLVWCALDRRCGDARMLNLYLRLFVRMTLASIIIAFGTAKLSGIQFRPPEPSSLLQTYGESSPMALFWTCVSHSRTYTYFAGGVEILGGMLLLSRRLTTLGALVCAGVMTNVFAINIGFDVPMKLFSLHLLAMSVVLILPDLPRLWAVLVLNSKVEPVACEQLFQRRSLHIAVTASCIACALVAAYGQVSRAGQDVAAMGILNTKPPLYGIWLVQEFEVDGDLKAPLLTDNHRWRYIVFERHSELSIHFPSAPRQRVQLQLDEQAGTIILSKRQDPQWTAEFSFRSADPRSLELTGHLSGQRLRAKLVRVEPCEFLLLKPGFQWVTE